MLKKTLLSALLLLTAAISTQEANLTSTGLLPEVVIVGKPIEREIFDVLVNGQDSVLVKNGKEELYVDVKPVDSLLARYILAQAYFESDSFSAPLAVQHSNYFGMQYPGRGKLTTALGPWAHAEGRSGYASYATPTDSALDLLLLLEYYNTKVPTSSPYMYARFLKSKHYYEAPLALYTANLKYHLQHVNNLFSKPV